MIEKIKDLVQILVLVLTAAKLIQELTKKEKPKSKEEGRK